MLCPAHAEVALIYIFWRSIRVCLMMVDRCNAACLMQAGWT